MYIVGILKEKKWLLLKYGPTHVSGPDVAVWWFEPPKLLKTGPTQIFYCIIPINEKTIFFLR